MSFGDEPFGDEAFGDEAFAGDADSARTGGWFTPGRKPAPQEPVPAGDLGGASWFASSRSAASQSAVSQSAESQHETAQSTVFQQAGEPGPPWAQSANSRGETAANSWAEVTRGGKPAGVNPNQPPRPAAGSESFPPHRRFLASYLDGTGDQPALGESNPFWGDDRRAGPAQGAGLREEHGGPAGSGPPAADDVPFAGARAIDVSASPGGLPRRAPAYGPASAARTQPRPGGATGALRRLRDTTGAMRAIMDTNAMRTLMDTAAMQMLRERYAGKGRAVAIVAVSFWVVLAALAIGVAVSRAGGGPAGSGSSETVHPAANSGTGSTTGGASGGASGDAGRPTAHPSTHPATHASTGVSQRLTVIGAEAFGPLGASDGDYPGLAARVISGSGTASWHTRQYATARFGGLQQGTGLVLDMGTIVTVARVTLDLAAGSASVTVRVGNAPVPGTFTAMGTSHGAGGTVTVTAGKPLHGRYIEIWITELPRDSAGSYEEYIYRVQVTGQA